MSNKYHARQVYYEGEKFDSEKEFLRYRELRMLEKAGQIYDLKRQVKFVLIPEQREESNGVYTKGTNKGLIKKGKVIERECSYIADFTYFDKDDNYIVEDTKGYMTKEFLIKKKMMLWVKGIRIKIS